MTRPLSTNNCLGLEGVRIASACMSESRVSPLLDFHSGVSPKNLVHCDPVGCVVKYVPESVDCWSPESMGPQQRHYPRFIGLVTKEINKRKNKIRSSFFVPMRKAFMFFVTITTLRTAQECRPFDLLTILKQAMLGVQICRFPLHHLGPYKTSRTAPNIAFVKCLDNVIHVSRVHWASYPSRRVLCTVGLSPNSHDKSIPTVDLAPLEAGGCQRE